MTVGTNTFFFNLGFNYTEFGYIRQIMFVTENDIAIMANSPQLIFGKSLDRGRARMYIVVNRCAGLFLCARLEITTIPATVGIGHAPVRASAVGFINLLVDVVG